MQTVAVSENECDLWVPWVPGDSLHKVHAIKFKDCEGRTWRWDTRSGFKGDKGGAVMRDVDSEAVSEWSLSTFGEATSLRLVTRANEEMAEAMRAYGAKKPEGESAGECVDVIIILCRLAHDCGMIWSFGHEPVNACEFARTDQHLLNANKMMGKLIEAIAAADRVGTWFALQETYQELWSFIRFSGHEPLTMVVNKMQENRSRNWTKTLDGSGYHVRPGSEREAKGAGPPRGMAA